MRPRSREHIFGANEIINQEVGGETADQRATGCEGGVAGDHPGLQRRHAHLSFAKTASRCQVVDQSALVRRESRPMITLLLHLLRLLPFLCGGHRHLALENLALRQQLAVYKRTTNRPRLRRYDRLLWVWLSKVWPAWRQALVIVAPATVLSWQRRRFRRHWAMLSGRPPAGRPAVDAAIKALVRSMAAANPLWVLPESMANCSSSASTSLSGPSPACSRNGAHRRRRRGARS